MVNAAPQKDNSNLTNMRNAGWPELPMPRDAHLLSPMSQALLRAARMGQVNKPPPPPLEEDKDPADEDDPDGDVDAAFVARRWAVVPRHLEGPEPEYLAKRRKGLPSVYGGPTGQAGSIQMRKTKIRKMDTEGNSSVWDVLVPEGQTVDGEIIGEETTQTHAPAPGTVVAGVGMVNAEGVVIAGDQTVPTPTKKRPPPPKRKAKGPGRGRKKRVGFVSISSGATAIQKANMGLTGPVVRNGVEKSKIIADQGARPGEIADDLVLHDGEQGGEDGSDDDEDGEEGEENDREEGELSPSPGSLPKSPTKPPTMPKVSEPEIIPDVPELTLTEPQIPIDRDPSSSPDLPLAAGQGFQPLVMQSQMMQSQVMQPQVMQPLVTQPLVVQPPVMQPPVPQSPVVQRPVVQPPLIQSQVTQPSVIQPPLIQSHVTQPSAIQPSLIRIDPAKEAVIAPAPSLQQILTTQRISVEEPPSPKYSSAHAELPPSHDPLNGLTEPKLPNKPPTNNLDDDMLHFPDGEQDLLGSLEMSLGRRGDGS